MKLATADEVLTRANVSSTVGASSTATVESALEAATTVVASILQTPLESAERIEYFDYNPSRYQGTFQPFKLKLTQRFVTDDAVKVYFSTDGYPAQISSNFEALSEDFSVSRYRGLVDIFSEPLRGAKTIAVKYAAGFDDGSGDIPPWMKEAAISAALHVHHAHKISHDTEDQPDMAKVMAGILYTQLSNFITIDYNASPSVDSRLL